MARILLTESNGGVQPGSLLTVASRKQAPAGSLRLNQFTPAQDFDSCVIKRSGSYLLKLREWLGASKWAVQRIKITQVIRELARLLVSSLDAFRTPSPANAGARTRPMTARNASHWNFQQRLRGQLTDAQASDISCDQLGSRVVSKPRVARMKPDFAGGPQDADRAVGPTKHCRRSYGGPLLLGRVNRVAWSTNGVI